ncbi:HipA domain-containing protein [Aurantibacillus circumpalustris]|uniref:HipA domain-containing protein n=1 Tax=Aurantibacillus circumpalustris TaxID=3036359 RepID=UPI00295B678A|nr:HipA domain-containing protein [Aurantibacillus circumpalustris]
MLKEEKIENYSGVNLNLRRCIECLKKDNWIELDLSVGGDAPKNFIAVYHYEKNSSTRKSNSKTWPKYIAKVGHKWYPLESINEYLFNQIGEVLGLRMAFSSLVLAGNQLRFLSRYFLKENESLEHGAQIFSGFIEDKDWVEDIEKKGLARRFFTFQFAEQAICHTYPNEAQPILEDFVKMLVFDALTGNNDRHFYNWGVIKHIESKKKPIFAPVFDSARGLFWNTSEGQLLSWEANLNLDERIRKYSEGSKPKIGWDGLEDLNHFELINKIFSLDSRYKEVCRQLINEENLHILEQLLDSDFEKLYSKKRMSLIKKCLVYRFNRLIEIINKKEVQNVS